MFAQLKIHLHHFDNYLLLQLKQGLDEGVIIEGAMGFAE
jgi:hypothetical protein